MRRLLSSFLLGAPLLAACAGGPDPLPAETRAILEAPATRDALAPQDLLPGECGLFLFEVREPNNFVLFENESRRVVRLIADGQLVETGVAPQQGAMTPGERFRRIYLDAERNVTYALTARIGEETGSGRRLEDAVLRARLLDGTEIVRPLAGLRRCMERRS